MTTKPQRHDMSKPYIARDTKQPLTVMGGYNVAQDGSVMRETIKFKVGDYGADPVGDGTFRMVPSGDVVTRDERNRRLAK
jgi:hypothetical protein